MSIDTFLGHKKNEHQVIEFRGRFSLLYQILRLKQFHLLEQRFFASRKWNRNSKTINPAAHP